jgi:hypothetical protein
MVSTVPGHSKTLTYSSSAVLWLDGMNVGATGYQTLINAALRENLEGKAPKFEDTFDGSFVRS